MTKRTMEGALSLGAAVLFSMGLVGSPLAHAGQDTKFEVVNVVIGLDADGMNIGFDDKGSNTRSFKIGNAEVTTVLKKDGTVGIKVLKGSLTLTSPSGENLATLTEGDDVEIDGFLDPSKMFELLHGNDSQVLRLGAVGTVAFRNNGTKPVNLTVGGVNFAVGANSGRQEAAIGKIYVGALPKNILTQLKKGESVIGLDGDGKPIIISRDRHGKDSRKQIDLQQFTVQKTRAGNSLLDARKIVPILGVPIKVVLDKTTIEITGTKDGAIIKVIDGEPLKLGTANAQYVGQLLLNSEIEISNLSLLGGAFYTPVSGSVLLLPVTATYTITNLGSDPLTLGKPGDQVRLNKNDKHTGNKGGLVTLKGFNPADLKNLPAGTGILVDNGNGDKVFLIVGDPLTPKKNGVDSFTLINVNKHTISFDIFNVGTVVTNSGGGLTFSTASLTLAVTSNQFIVQIPIETFLTCKNTGVGNSVIIVKETKTLLLVMGGNTVGQAKDQQGKDIKTSNTAIFVLGGKVTPFISTMLASNGGTGVITTIPVVNSAGKKTGKTTTVLVLTDSKGGTVILPLVLFVDTSKILNGSVTSASP